MPEDVAAVQKLLDTTIEFFTTYAFQVVGAIIVLALGAIAGRWIAKVITRTAVRRSWDPTLAKLGADAARFVVLGFALMTALGKFGLSISPLLAALGGVVFGASFALQGTFANFGAGIVIIVTRPFVVGDTIAVAGVGGLVDKVGLGATVLVDEDGVRITVPNKSVVGQVLHNSRAERIVEGEVGIAYGADPAAAIAAIAKVLAATEAVTQDPAPRIGVAAFGDSAINIGYRYWVPTHKYFATSYAVNLEVFRALGAAGIGIPFPQREVRMLDRVG